MLTTASILAARRLANWDGRPSPAFESAISDAIAVAKTNSIVEVFRCLRTAIRCKIRQLSYLQPRLRTQVPDSRFWGRVRAVRRTAILQKGLIPCRTGPPQSGIRQPATAQNQIWSM